MMDEIYVNFAIKKNSSIGVGWEKRKWKISKRIYFLLFSDSSVKDNDSIKMQHYNKFATTPQFLVT